MQILLECNFRISFHVALLIINSNSKQGSPCVATYYKISLSFFMFSTSGLTSRHTSWQIIGFRVSYIPYKALFINITLKGVENKCIGSTLDCNPWRAIGGADLMSEWANETEDEIEMTKW